jgi:hypothetical protein
VSHDQKERHLHYLWNTLKFFAHEDSYTMGERTGGVLQGCPREPPPTTAQLALYGLLGLESLCRYIGREPDEWMLGGSPPPQDAALARKDALLREAREALWVCTEHDALHFGEQHNTVIQGRAVIAAIDAELAKEPT